jgi:LysR family transcriptional regulator, glycine cleavage system transcriptional activator
MQKMQRTPMRFLLTSKECELLLVFEHKGSLEELSLTLHKDISVISRNLKQIAEKSPLLEKHHGKWTLTEKGKALNRWTKEAIMNQRLAVEQQRSIKIATTREFANRILLPTITSLVEEKQYSVSIIASDSGIEDILLAGNADFGFDCGRPYSPNIAYKRLISERFVVVAAPSFIVDYHISTFADLPQSQHLKFVRSEGAVWDMDTEPRCHLFGTFNDMANIREACLLGYGWAIIPFYMVKKEVANGLLSVIAGRQFPEQKFGLWWLRDRRNLSDWLAKATSWLLQQDLG